MRRACISLFILWVAASSARAELIAPPMPEPPLRDEAAAREAYDAAAKLAQRGRFAAALEHATRSVALAPSARRAALLGAIHGELGHTREALEAIIIAVNLDAELVLEDYLFNRLSALPPFEPSDLGIVRLQVDPSEVSCELEATAERFELSARRVAIGIAAGRQAITCTAPGFEPTRLEIPVLARRVVTASLRLVPHPSAARQEPTGLAPGPESVRPEAREVHQPSLGGTRVLPLALAIGGGVAIAGGVGLHLWALDAKADGRDAAHRAKRDPGLSADEYNAARDDYVSAGRELELRRGLAIGGYALGVVLIGSALVLALGDDDDPAPVTIMPSVSGDRVGATCGLSF
jgi:hypothetical protein